MSKAAYNLDLGDFADDASDELIGDESYAQRGELRREQQTEAHGTLSTVSWWWRGSVMLVVRRSHGGGTGIKEEWK